MRTVLITGGAGFIGSHVAEHYYEKGYQVVVVDNLSSGCLENIAALEGKKSFAFCKADIRNMEELEKVFIKYNPDLINHHAAQKSVPASVEDPKNDLDINLNGFLNLILLAQKYKVKQFISVSSGGALSKEILGNEQSRESDVPQLVSPYAINKFASEKYLELYSKLYDFEYTILRYSNVYGPRQIADGECGVIPIFINNIVAGRESVLMTYDDMPRGCTRDYVFVKDVADANMLASEKPSNTVINIGSGQEEGILDIYETILETFGVAIPIKIQGPRLGDVKRSVLDAGKAKEMIGWVPQTSLREGLSFLKNYINF